MHLATGPLGDTSICMSTWLMVLARGLIAPVAAAVAEVPATLFFRMRLAPGAAPAALSRRFRGREGGAVV